MIFLSYTWHKKTFSEIDELQHMIPITDSPGKGYDIFQKHAIYFIYQPTKVIAG